MQAVFHQDGDAIDYTPVSDTPAGTVVIQGELVGVTKAEIKAGKLGAISVEGVFDATKEPGLPMAIGDLAYWDVVNLFVTGTASGNTLLGKVVKPAEAIDVTVRVRLTPCAFPVFSEPEFSSSSSGA
jgi:predicted RecA/RadA family phage recombinase